MREHKIKMHFIRQLRRLFIEMAHKSTEIDRSIQKICNNKLTHDDDDEERWHDGRLILKSYQINIIPFTNGTYANKHDCIKAYQV